MCARELSVLYLLNTIYLRVNSCFITVHFIMYILTFLHYVYKMSYMYDTRCEVHCSKDTFNEVYKGFFSFLFLSFR